MLTQKYDTLACKIEMVIELDVNKENTYLVSENEDTCYIMGIGETDYTIHREAKKIDDTYNCDGYLRDFSILDKHNYHVFLASIRSIVQDIKWKSKINYKGEIYDVVDAYIGVKGKCKARLEQGYVRGGYRSLEFEGDNLGETEEKIKYVITVS